MMKNRHHTVFKNNGSSGYSFRKSKPGRGFCLKIPAFAGVTAEVPEEIYLELEEDLMKYPHIHIQECDDNIKTAARHNPEPETPVLIPEENRPQATAKKARRKRKAEAT